MIAISSCITFWNALTTSSDLSIANTYNHHLSIFWSQVVYLPFENSSAMHILGCSLAKQNIYCFNSVLTKGNLEHERHLLSPPSSFCPHWICLKSVLEIHWVVILYFQMLQTFAQAPQGRMLIFLKHEAAAVCSHTVVAYEKKENNHANEHAHITV